MRPEMLHLLDVQDNNAKMLPEKRPVVKQPLRKDIQTLRAISIIFVLLYHTWPSKIWTGFLGVDVFFAISGYLMYKILSKKLPLTFNEVFDFYYRRIKRIVPLYMFVIFCVLIVASREISPFDFIQLVQETIPALFFYSNVPTTRTVQYFDLSSKNYFFIHTWSLSVELQFYLIVPLLVFVLDRIENWPKIVKVVSALIIPFLSLTYQCTATGDNAHMLLIARMWQFFVGFAASHRYKSQKEENNLPNIVLHFLLCILLTCNLPLLTQITRLAVVLIVGIIISRNNEKSWVSSNFALVELGNVSYSVYLIHWPVFTLYRYLNLDDERDEASLQTGFALILISIILGFIVEKTFVDWLKCIQNWISLISVLIIGIFINSAVLYHLHSNAVNYEAPEVSDGEWKQTLKDINLLWKIRDSGLKIAPEQVIAFNIKLAQLVHSNQGWKAICQHQSTKMPSNFEFDLKNYGKLSAAYACHEKGRGNKNIVIIGNSHAHFNYIGIREIFKDVYRNLTLIARNSCQLMDPKFVNATPEILEKHRGLIDECEPLRNAFIPLLQGWKTPIDVIIVLNAPYAAKELPISDENVESDELYQELQAYYSELAKIPRDALIFMSSYPFYRAPGLRKVRKRLLRGKSIQKIGVNEKALESKQPLINQRLRAVECKNCLKVDLIKFWCHRTKDEFCHVVDPSGLAYYFDTSHVTPLGAMYNAEFILKMYNTFVAERALNATKL